MNKPLPAGGSGLHAASERRAKRRYPMFVDALLSGLGTQGRACTIRDCCTRGMRLSFEPSGPRQAPALFRVNQKVGVHFVVVVNGTIRSVAVGARVARVFDNGIGVRLVGVTDQIIAAMRALVAATVSAPNGRRPQPSGNHAVADDYGTLMIRPLTPVAASPANPIRDKAARAASCGETMLEQDGLSLARILLKTFERNLLLALRDAPDPGEQRRLNDVLNKMEQAKLSLTVGIVGELRKEWTQLFASRKPGAGSALAKRSLHDSPLMQTVDLNAFLAFAEIVDRIEMQFRPQTSELERQLSHLLGVTIDQSNNPLSVERVCRAIYELLLDRWYQPFLGDHLRDALNEGLPRPLGELYDKLILALAGIGDAGKR